MAAKTTVKVAVTNNAAKDDYFSDLSWLQEDAALHGNLNVLGNDPGSAKIIGVSQNLPTSTANMVNSGATFVPAGFTGALVVTINAGQLEIDATALNADLQSLGEGMSTSITFYYTAQMANGAYSTAKVTIEIEGTNDDPLFSASSVLAGTINDTADDDSFSAVTGSVSATDVDTNDAGLLTFGLADGENGLSDYGTFSIDSAGNWTFTPDDSAVEGLKTTVVETFQIEVNDGHGGTATQTVTVTLNGVNDTASISGDNAGSAAEGGTLTDSGVLAVSDRDVGDGVFQAASAADLDGALGDFTFNAATGAWDFTLDDAAAQGLGEGEIAYETLTVTSLDGTDSETITVTITGKNDAATIGGTDSGDVTEDGTLVATGTLTVDDVDGSDEESFQAATIAGAYGTLVLLADGSWTYTLDNGDSGLDDLDSGEQDVETFTVKAFDGTEHVITVNVHGADEAPVGPVVPPDNGYANNAGDDQDYDDPNSVAQFVGATVITGNSNGTNGVDVLLGNNSAQTLSGRQADDYIHGAGGGDTLNGGQDNDHIYGGSGDDTINGNEGSDDIYGGSGGDGINGGAGNDTIHGGSGNDNLSGDDGSDQLWGGAGADTFRYSAASQSTSAVMDTVRDFSRVEGDKIDLAGLGLIWGGILSSAGDLGQDQVGYVVNGDGSLTVFADTNHDGDYDAGVDLSFNVAGSSNLVAGDFLF